ncbi:MAG: hypothetical protein ABSC06_29780, partial [Rhodopila sp.]
MKIGRRSVLAAASTLLPATFARSLAAQGSPRLFTMVVGIDAYPHVKQLKGCVNDAQAISEAIAPFASPLVMLINADATRERVLTTWDGF